LFLQAGPDLNSVTNYGNTALSHAADVASAEFLWILLSAGPDGMAVDKNGEHGPLSSGIGSGSAVKVGLLLCYGVQVDHVDKWGQNILHFAARYASIEAMKMIESWGPSNLDTKLRDGKDKTPMDVLADRNDLCDELVAAMESLLDCVNKNDREETTKEKVARVRKVLEGYEEFQELRKKWPLSVQGFEP
jgi:hypothetical protein